MTTNRGFVMAGDERTNIFREETDDPRYADQKNFYKLETWSKDGMRVTGMLWAGSNLETAHVLFRDLARGRPRSRLTIRQRTRVIAKWPNKR